MDLYGVKDWCHSWYPTARDHVVLPAVKLLLLASLYGFGCVQGLVRVAKAK